MWAFWRIVIIGNESFTDVDNLTLHEIMEYNTVLNIKDAIMDITTKDVENGNS